MFQVFLVIQVIITAAMIGFILLQRTDSDGMSGLSGGSTNANAFLTGRGTANFMTRTTAILATLFMVNSLWLSILAGKENQHTSIADKITQSNTQKEQAPEAEKTPTSVPAAADAPVSKPVAPADAPKTEATPATDVPASPAQEPTATDSAEPEKAPVAQ